MRKILSLILTFMMLCTFAVPAHAYARADQKIKLDDAINTAKEKLSIKTENYNFNYNYNENNLGVSAYDLSWTSKKSNGGSINVSVNSETGEIISFYQWETTTDNSSMKIPKYSRDKALKAAEKFIKKLAAEKFSQTVLKDVQQSSYDKPLYSDSYSFNFVRKVNGLEFQDNGFNITLDKNTLKIRSYNMNWDNATFAEPSKAIGLDAAKKIFAEKLGIELSYYMIYDYEAKTQTPILVYTYANANNPIDALTGDIITNGYMPRYEMDSAAKQNSATGTLTPEEQKSVDASSKYLTKDASITEVKKYLPIDDTMKLSYSNLYMDIYDGSASWAFSWDKNDTTGKYYSSMSATVNAITGKIKAFSINGNEFYPEKETPVAYTKEQAKNIAENFINTIETDKFKLTVYKNDYSQINPTDKVSDYSFRYVGKINGATCDFDSFNVIVNAYSGKIMSYSMEWKDVTLPSVDGAMTLENAYKALYAKASLNLKYQKFYNYNNPKAVPFEIKMAYVLDDFSGMFDAKTGTFIDYSGKPIKEKKAVHFTDIKGNVAENDINILVDLGVIDSEESTFSPNNAILQKDFIKLLVKTLAPSYVVTSDATLEGSNKEYDQYYQTAVQHNILNESQINPTAKVTKLDAVKLIVRTMGLGYVAENGNIFKLQYKDANKISNSYKGYVAIAAGLNIIKLTTANFDGIKAITKGQTATMIVNYMKVDLAK
jgi:hypothetical protein